MVIEMEEIMEMWLSPAKSQIIFAERETKIEVTIRNAEKIAQYTEGKVYFNRAGELDAVSNYFLVRQRIVYDIREKAVEKAKKIKQKEVTIDVEELDWKKIRRELEQATEREGIKKKKWTVSIFHRLIRRR